MIKMYRNLSPCCFRLFLISLESLVQADKVHTNLQFSLWMLGWLEQVDRFSGEKLAVVMLVIELIVESKGAF